MQATEVALQMESAAPNRNVTPPLVRDVTLDVAVRVIGGIAFFSLLLRHGRHALA